MAFNATSQDTESALLIKKHLNVSLQVGDLIYCNCISPVISSNIGYAISDTDPIILGEVTELTLDSLTESWNWIGIKYSNYFTGINITAPIQGCPVTDLFLTFSKNNSVNKSSLKGYFNLVNFQNNSKIKAELFSVNSEVTLSSK